MCTSFITLKGEPLSAEEQNLILNLGNIVSVFLSHCLEYGKVIILTNSSENWVKKTSIENLGITDLIDKTKKKSTILRIISILTSKMKRLKKKIK